MESVTFRVLASPLHDAEALEQATRRVRSALAEVGGVEADEAGVGTPHCIVVATGGTEAAIIEAVTPTDASTPWAPALLIAHPRQNSLPAALEALAALHQDGRRGRVVFIDDDTALDDLIEAIDDLRTWHRFHATRLGLVGPPSDWLIASTPNSRVVARSWGPSLVDVSVPETVAAFHDVPVELGRRVADRLGGAAADTLPPPADVATAARLDPALRRMIERDDLDAITVRCFDFLGSIQTSGCVALAQLNDDGIVAGCEGDVPAALALLWARYLLDRPGWIANPAAISTVSNTIVLAHCTIAPSMVRDLELSTHFESGIGVGLHGRLRADDVTLVRVGGRDLDRCWIAEGRVCQTGDDPHLCRTQATVEVDDGQLAELLTDPLGNHLVVIEGRHRRRLERWWNWAIAPLRP